MRKRPRQPPSSTVAALPRQAMARGGAAKTLPRGPLGTAGHPLDHPTRAAMEAHFKHDFSGVRVHTDPAAADRAQAVGAQAYTAHPDIVFAPGQYRPQLPDGQALIAHELTHIVQQEAGRATGIQRRPPGGEIDDPMEREAREKERDVGRKGHTGTPTRREFLQTVIPPAPLRPTQLDQTANDIIRDAQDAKRDIGVRAVAAVWAIIHAYYSDQSGKVSVVGYSEADPGLTTTYQGKGASATGQITVGRSFVENTTSQGLARRVLQVAHELEHVDQIRAGMAGQTHKSEREFLAFYHEALAPEVAHTGRVSHSTRVDLIDAALGNFYCLDAAGQTQHATKQQELLARRTTETATGRTSAAAPPTSCKS